MREFLKDSVAYLIAAIVIGCILHVALLVTIALWPIPLWIALIILAFRVVVWAVNRIVN